MKNIVYAVVLLLLSLGGVVARKTYFRLPVMELKRRGYVTHVDDKSGCPCQRAVRKKIGSAVPRPFLLARRGTAFFLFEIRLLHVLSWMSAARTFT